MISIEIDVIYLDFNRNIPIILIFFNFLESSDKIKNFHVSSKTFKSFAKSIDRNW